MAEQENTAPIVILVRPQMGENIGASARAMANFGVKEMRLVAPRDGWPNPRAGDMAGKAIPILDDAEVFAQAAQSVGDCQYVLAATARARAGNVPVLSAREAMAALHARQAKGERCAILFGPERTGLENEEVALADAVVAIPVAAEYPSLNLAQAVVVVLYEWFSSLAAPSGISSPRRGEARRGALADAEFQQSPHPDPSPAGEGMMPAPREELLGLFGQLEEALDAVNFWRVPEKKNVMWQHLRATLTRVRFTSQEIATWRGLFRALKGD